MNEYLIITGVNAPANPGNNAFNKIPVILPFLVSVRPAKVIDVNFFVDRFVFRTNGDHPAKIDLYTFLN